MNDQQRQLVEEHIPMARRLAARFRRWMDDADEVAMLGLALAVERYRPEEGPFLSYAVPTIAGELKRAARDYSRVVRLPRSVHDALMAIQPMVRTLQQRHGREPTIGELVDASGFDEALVIEALGAWARQGDEIDDDDARLADHSENVTRSVMLDEALAELDEKDRDAVIQYYFEERTQQEIADQTGVSQMQIHRRLKRALDRMASQLDEPGSDG